MTLQNGQTLEYTTRTLSSGFEKHSGNGNTAETRDMQFLARTFRNNVQPWQATPEPGLNGSRIVELSIFKSGTLVNHYSNGDGWDKVPQTEAERTLVAAITETFPTPTADND